MVAIKGTSTSIVGRWRSHRQLLLLVVAAISVPKIIFWSYVFSFGGQIARIVDLAFLSNFILRLLAAIVLSSALAAFFLGLVFILLAFLPRRFLKYSRARRAYRFFSFSLVPRFVAFAVVFCITYLGFGFLKSLVSSGGVGWIAGMLISRLSSSLTRPEKTYRLSGSQAEDLLREIDETILSGDEKALCELKKKAEALRPSMYREFDEARKDYKYLFKETRSLERSKLLLFQALAGFLGIVLMVVGVSRAEHVKTMDPVEIEFRMGSIVQKGEFVIVGSTSSQLVVFEPSVNRSIAVPFSAAKVIEQHEKDE